MSHINRRTMLVAASAAVAAPAIISRSTPALAAAPMLGVSPQSFRRIKVGNFEVTTLLAGSRMSDGPHPTFGQNQSAEDMAALLKENGLPETRVQFYFTPTIVNTGNELVLFDAGLGGETPPLIGVLEQAGYSTDQVDVVVLTHMHPDHIGGLMASGSEAYPNARYVTGQIEYDFWAAEDRMSGPTERVATLVNSNVKPVAEKMTFLGDEGEVVSGISAFAAFGHTPGHMCYRIESEGRQLMVWADAANHFVASIQRPDWHVRFDMDKEAAAATRKRLFDMSAADNLAMIGYHMPFPGIGYVRKSGTSYRWDPMSYQFAE
ncbi:MAG: MBL fold metallo-hydrolase [Pseudomonadota bacterium]